VASYIVIPCYNEAQRLDAAAFECFGPGRDGEVRFVFVDDGSVDGTRDCLTELAGSLPGAEVLGLDRNVGKAEAVRRGVLHALELRSDAIGFWDADLATPLPVIDEFRDLLASRDDVDIVLGSRVRLLGRSIARRPARHYAGRVFASVTSLLLGLDVYDTQCGAKLFRVTPDLYELFASPFITRWLFDVEIIARATVAGRRNGVKPRIYEYPLPEWRDVHGSKLRLTDAARVPFDLSRIYDAYLRGPR